MQLQNTPATGPRYWVGICLASIVGCNLGDVLPDVLKMTAGAGLVLLMVLFAVTILADRLVAGGSEVFYWVAILIVRAAATNIADLGIGMSHRGYLPATALLAALLAVMVALDRPPPTLPRGIPSTGARYWVTMLIAGTLGTVIADGVGHTISPVDVGVPVCAAMATLALATILVVRRQSAGGLAVLRTYWIAIVTVRVWGTSVGDIAAFLLSLPVSVALSGLIMTATLLAWPKRNPVEVPIGAG